MTQDTTANSQTPTPLTAQPPPGELHHFSANIVPSIGSGTHPLTESVNCVPPIGSGASPSGNPPKGGNPGAK